MTERQYIADFITLCVDRVADTDAFLPAKTLHDCFTRFMAAKHPRAAYISGKLFVQLFDTQDGVRGLAYIRGILPSSTEDLCWGFKNLALTSAGKKLLEENRWHQDNKDDRKYKLSESEILFLLRRQPKGKKLNKTEETK